MLSMGDAVVKLRWLAHISAPDIGSCTGLALHASQGPLECGRELRNLTTVPVPMSTMQLIVHCLRLAPVRLRGIHLIALVQLIHGV